MARIVAERRRLAACRRFTLASGVCMAALIALVPIIGGLAAELRASGFAQLIELAFSDTRLVIANWQDYALSLLESFPIMNAVGVLAVIAVILACASVIFRYFSSLAPNRHLRAVNQ